MKDTISLKAELKAHAGPIYSLMVNDGALYSAGSDGALRKWKVSDEIIPIKNFKHTSGFYTIEPMAEQLILGTINGTVLSTSVGLKEELTELTHHDLGVYSLLFSASQDTLFSGGGDGMLNITSVKNKTEKSKVAISQKKIRCISLNKAGTKVLVGAGDGCLSVIDIASLELEKRIQISEKSLFSIANHPSKGILVIAGADGILRFWKEDSEKELFSIPAHKANIYSVEFSPKGDYCLTASRDKTIKIWDASSFELVSKVERKSHQGHTHSVNSVKWLSPKSFVSAGDDGVIKLWEIGS